MEPFWDLKIGKYIEYLTHISSEYIIYYNLHATFSDKYGWPVLYLARRPQPDRPERWKLYFAVKFISVINYHFRGRETPSPRVRHQICALCWQPFTTCTTITMQILAMGTWYSFSYTQAILTFDFRLWNDDPGVHGKPKYVYTMWLIGNHEKCLQ